MFYIQHLDYKIGFFLKAVYQAIGVVTCTVNLSIKKLKFAIVFGWEGVF